MPSGGITITPGYQLAPGEKVNNSKLNQGFQPVGRVDEGAIGSRELDESVLPGKNLLCNGDFNHWASADYLLNGITFANGVSGNPYTHDYAAAPVSGVRRWAADRWVTPNSAARAFDRQAFSAGQSEVPDNPLYFMRVTQSAPYSGIDPAYIGQRLEGVFPFSGHTYTFSIWVRVFPAAGGVPTFEVKPVCRLYFGSTGSTEIVLLGTPVTLPADGTWIQIKETFTIPDISGKTISGAAPYNYPFTEFRLQMPQSTIFGIDIAHAAVVNGSNVLPWDQRLPHEDLLFGWRYLQVLGFIFVNAAQLATFPPFANLRTTMMKDWAYLDLYPAFSTGTGGTVGFGATYKDAIFQANAHSTLSGGYVIIAGELQSAT